MGVEIDRLEIAIEAKATKANEQLDKLCSKLEKMASCLNGINLSKIGNIGNSFKTTTTNAGKTESALQRLSNSMDVLTGKSEKSARANRSLSQVFGSFYANCFLLIRGFKALGRSVEKSMDYIETFNYYNVTMDKIANDFAGKWKEAGYDSAESYAESFRGRLDELTTKMSGYTVGKDGFLNFNGGQNLSLDPEQIMNYEAVISSITNSVGMLGENSIAASKALTMLSADWSSLTNRDLSQVMTNFQSGLIGQSRALYKYGIDITNNTLQTYAYANGVNKAVQEMTQAEKMQLRLLAILDQSKVAYGDMANTINSVANQYRIFRQQISNVARTIGNLFIPIIQKVLPYINAFVMALQRLFSFIGGKIFGKKWNNIMDGISLGYGGAGDAIGDIDDSGIDDVADSAGNASGALDDANKSAKKLKNTLFGFDEMNVLPDDTDYSSAGNSGTGGIGGGGSPIDLSDAIADALADYEKVWNDALSKMQNKAQEYSDAICDAFDKIWKTAEPTREAIVRLWNEGLSKLGDFTWGTIKDFWENFLKPMGAWMLGDNAGLPRFFNITNAILNEIDWNRLKRSLADFYEALQKPTKFVWTGLMDFYEHFLKPVAVWTMGKGIPQLVDALTRFVETIHWDKINKSLRDFWDALAPFAKSVGQGMIDFFKGLLNVGADFINKVVPGGLDALANALKKIKPETAEKIGKALGGLLVAILAFKGIGTAVKKLADFGTKLKAMGEGLGALFGTSGIFATISSKITGLGKLFKPFMSGGVIYEAIGSVAMNFSILMESLIGISIPVGAAMAGIIVAIAGVAAALIDLWKTSETFRDTMKMAFGNVWDSLKESLSKIGDAISKVWDKIKEFGKALYEFYENSVLKKIVEVLAELLAVLVSIAVSTVFKQIASAFQMLADVLSGVLDIATGFIEILTGILTLNPDLILEGFGKIGEGIVGVFTGLTDWVSSWFTDFWSSIPGKLIEAIASVPERLVEWAQNLLITIQTEVPKIIDSIVQFFAELPNKIGYAIGFAVGKLAEWILKLSETVGAQIPKVINKIQKFFAEVPGKIWDAIVGAVAKLGQWGLEMLAKVAEVIPKIPKAIFDFFKDLPKNLYEIGKNLILGFFKGIADFVVDVYNKIKEFVQNVIKGFKDGFDIHSPSRVLYSIGENVIKGFSNALTDRWSGVQKQLGSLVSSASKTLGEGLEKIWSRAKSAVSSIQSLVANIKLPHVNVSWNKMSIGKTTVSLPSFGISYYESGGFPNSGELFMARENGINEMVGRMGNRSTVANNDQITEGISAAVGPAVYDAVLNALAASGGHNDGDLYLTLELAGEKFITKVVKEYNKMKKSDPGFGFLY